MTTSTTLPLGWRATTLSEVVDFKSGGTPAKNDDRFWGGAIPWVSAKDLKSLRISDSADHLTVEGATRSRCVEAGTVLLLVRGMALHKDVPMGVATRSVSFNQDVKGLVPRGEVYPDFILNLLLARKEDLLKNVESAGHGTGKLNTDFLQSLPILIPPLAEQKRITEVLSTWDDSLMCLARQIARKHEATSYLREALVRGALRMKRRFKPWPVVSLGDVTENLSARNSGRFDRNSVMGVTKADGLVPMKEHVIADDIGRYLILPPGGFAYNPMRINIGSITMSEFEEDVIVSPDYVVFACDASRLLPRFLNHVRRTKAWSDFMTIAGNGSVRVRIYYASLADFEFHLPPLDEQRAIVEVLDDAEREILSLMAEQAALEKQRDALATELLTGRLRVRGAAKAAFAR
ncbi:MAG TPA: restriction endonuclease subunit S [Bauldia sp.]|nr:restriction endonuclease subunit S [Bauldia sp.]